MNELNYTKCTDKDMFRSAMRGLIASKVASIIAGKPDDKKFLNHAEFCHVCDCVSEMCRLQFGEMKPAVEGSLSMCKAITAPMDEKIVLLKNAAIGIGGIAGLAAIITGIGIALGWGSGVIAAVITFFTGAPLLGPIAWIAAGATLVLIAGYMAFGSDEAQASSRAIDALYRTMDEVINQIWS